MTRLFGTDGVRGVANTELSCQLAFKLGQAAVAKLGKTIVIGKDTRLSGDMLEASVVAGITSMGGTAFLAGIVPTPAVALLVREMYCDAGIVISASHNPPEYNGIKFFNAQGFKLSDELEAAIEDFVAQGGADASILPAGDATGMAIPLDDEASDIYIDHCVEAIASQGISFDGLKIALDTGHGAASFTSVEALTRLGAEVHAINTDFTGTDINVNCGSTHLEPLVELVAQTGADLGIAHDGDADRVLFVSPTGELIDGDCVLAVCARDLHAHGELTNSAVVGTVMSNLGFVNALNQDGISVVQAKVGDRYVLESMQAEGYVLGGEQSGHTIFLNHNTTGDGLMTACMFIAACLRSKTSFADAAHPFVSYPQTLINVRVANQAAVLEHSDLHEAIAQVEEALGSDGRVLLRPSGTEPLIRVMVEAQDATLAQRSAEQLASIVERLGA